MAASSTRGRIHAAWRQWSGLLLTSVLLLVSGCTPRAFLKPGENLLYRVQLKGVKQADPVAIEALYQQQPQTTLPIIGGTPKLWFWVQGSRVFKPEKIDERLKRIDDRYAEKIRQAAGDSLKVSQLFDKRDKRRRNLALRKEKGNFLMRKLGEPPVIYDSVKTAKTVDQLLIYLGSKGFFRANVAASSQERHRKVVLTLTLTEGPESRVVALHDSIADPVVAAVVARDRDSLSHLKEDGRLLLQDTRYDADVLGRERTRLEALLRNRGYFDFRQQYITFVADTTDPVHVKVTTIIANPPGATHHAIFKLRRVLVIEDADRPRFGLRRDTAVYDGVRYLAYERKIRPWALARKNTLLPGQAYSIDRTNRAQRQLSDLDLFRYVSVSFERVAAPTDSLRRDNPLGAPIRELDATVSLAPQRKYQEITEVGVGLAVNIPGPFGSERLRIRNVNGGGEILDLGLRGALEGQYPFVSDPNNPNQGVTALQLGGNVGLIFPRVLLAQPRFDRKMAPYNPRTRLNMNYTYVRRDEYTRSNLEFTYDYVWQRTPRLQYVVTPADLSIINVPRTNPAFQAQLDTFARRGFPLNQSFKAQLVPSMNFQRIYNSNDFAQTLDAAYSRLLLEVGGLTNLLTNYGTFTDDQLGLPVRSFAKVALDMRRYWKLAPRSFLVGRFNGGAARPLESAGGSIDLNPTDNSGLGVLPYDKYFFAGGASSVRAWRPRRLGPGSYAQPDQRNGNNDKLVDVIEQPGQVLLEGNLEYRAHLFSFFNGAIFLDAGNVWSLADDSRTGAKFSLRRFYREFAVGTGVGLRFDFTFLVLRLDVATKVYDPAGERRPEVGRNYVFGKFGDYNRPAFNLGIGYPF